MIDMGIIIINSYAVAAASATAGISLTILADDGSSEDGDGDCLGLKHQNNVASTNGDEGETLQIQYTGSGGSTIAYTFTRSGGSGLAVGSLTDLPPRNSMQVLAWKGNVDPQHGSATDVTLSGTGGTGYTNVHTTVTESGTWYAKVINGSGGNFDVVIAQDVDSSTATASVTETIVDNS